MIWRICLACAASVYKIISFVRLIRNKMAASRSDLGKLQNAKKLEEEADKWFASSG